MEVEVFIKKMKDIYSVLMDFIESEDDSKDEFDTIINFFEKQKILENKKEVRLIFQLISKISDNYHRTSSFFDKLEKIFQYLIKDTPSPISDFIPDYTKYNKKILFHLLDKKLIKPDESFLQTYLLSKPDEKNYYYLYPKVKEFLEEEIRNQIEKEILEKYDEEIKKFEEKCQIGENDSYICSLIRTDSVEEFISYINRINLSLSTKIKHSVYETNSFLIYKEPTLIEYAAFFGSIQIIQYLKYNKVPLTFSLWSYTVHSNNAELIHFLEENEVKPENKYYIFRSNEELTDDVLIESIKCHHNAISNYIKDNLYDKIQTDDLNKFYDDFGSVIADSLNFFFFPNEIESIICKPKNNKGFKLSQLCFSLTKFTIPSTVNSIGDYAFYNCTKLTQILIPSSINSIGDYAFSGCSSLTQISIPSSVTSIGNNVFRGCSSLTQISIPSSVNSIGNNAFFKCSSLTQVSIPSSVTSFGNRIFDGLIKLDINIQYIPNNLFARNSSLTKIIITYSITSIENATFNECSSLTEITLPSSVIRIGDFSFYNCSSLTKITIPSSVTRIGNYCFYGCSKLTQIIIPSSVTSIEKGTFNGCTSLAKITIPSSVISIGDFSFCKCSSLIEIMIPSSVTRIGNCCFYGCSKLTQIAIPSSVTSIEKGTFNGCASLAEITIPSSVVNIGDFSFCKCSSLGEITIPSSVTRIGNCCFYRCSKLSQVAIPSSITTIGNNAFNGCSSLTKIEIPSSVTSIGNFAFLECPLLSQISIHSSIKDSFFKNHENEINMNKNLIERNKLIIDIQTNIDEEYALIKKLNKTVILGSEGSGKTSLSWILSGKDVKVTRIKRFYSFEEIYGKWKYNRNKMAEVMIDGLNKNAFIESHILDEEASFDYDDEIKKIYTTQYILNSNKNEARIKILLVIQVDIINCCHGNVVVDLFKKFNALFPDLNEIEKKAVGIVFSRANDELEPNDYFDEILDQTDNYTITKWCRYFIDHPEQAFIMPRARRDMNEKIFDFEDKYKILDFIKKDQFFIQNSKLQLSSEVKEMLSFLQIDNE